MSKRSTTAFTIAAFLALPLAACDDGPTGPASGSTSIQLTAGAVGSSASLISFSQHGEAGGNLSLDMVSSIDVTLERVEALKLEEDAEARWVQLDVEDEPSLDLLALPEDGGVEVARGELEAGDYCNVRFFVADATITFSEDVTQGGGPTATTFEADTPHDLFIPSSEQTGVKVPTARFSVDGEQETVSIAFDAGESVQTVNLTATGPLMTPVLTAEDGEDIPECDVVDDGENGEEDTDGDTNGEE